MASKVVHYLCSMICRSWYRRRVKLLLVTFGMCRFRPYDLFFLSYLQVSSLSTTAAKIFRGIMDIAHMSSGLLNAVDLLKRLMIISDCIQAETTSSQQQRDAKGLLPDLHGLSVYAEWLCALLRCRRWPIASCRLSECRLACSLILPWTRCSTTAHFRTAIYP